MAHFVQLDKNNQVTEVVVVPNEEEHRGEEFLHELGLEGSWVQTSYNANFRGFYAGIGDYYDQENDIFVARESKKTYGFILKENLQYINIVELYQNVTFTNDESMFMVTWIGDTPEILDGLLEIVVDTEEQVNQIYRGDWNG
jgi:hypothetical protein